jgi:hypothetical protein
MDGSRGGLPPIKLIANKSGYLNFPFWIVGAAIFLLGWNLWVLFKKNCFAAQD